MNNITSKIGFIGLGLMGQGFTRRLTECGFSVAGYDLDPDKIARAGEHGVTAAASPADVAQASDVVMMCVTSTQHVEDAVFGNHGIASAASSNGILVDHSTSIVEDGNG